MNKLLLLLGLIIFVSCKTNKARPFRCGWNAKDSFITSWFVDCRHAASYAEWRGLGDSAKYWLYMANRGDSLWRASGNKRPNFNPW